QAGARRVGRCAVAAELQEAAGRTGARTTIATPDAERWKHRRWLTEASPGPEASARRDRAVGEKKRCARGTRALESASPRCRLAPAARRRARGRDAGTLSHRRAPPRHPAARAARPSAAPGSARSRRDAERLGERLGSRSPGMANAAQASE